MCFDKERGVQSWLWWVCCGPHVLTCFDSHVFAHAVSLGAVFQVPVYMDTFVLWICRTKAYTVTSALACLCPLLH